MKLYQKPIHTLHQQRLAKEVTTEEIAQSVLQRITETEQRLGSYLAVEQSEAVMERAKAVDQQLQKGEEVNPLAGMPIAVKDIFNIKGQATTCASEMLKNFIAPYESTVTQKLLAQGYNLVGKTNMDEFAMGSSTEHSAFQVTKNPWDLERVPGGSSGGSASAVAAGQALAALGTDTGGSIRQPASFCGIVGVKPTYGRVSRWGIVAYASSLDQAGPMTRDVEDAALMLEAIMGHDKNDSTSLTATPPDLMASLRQEVKGMKIGVIQDLDLSACDSEVQRVFAENLETLKQGGAEICPVSLPNLQHAVATYYVLAPSEASSNLGRYDGIRYGYRSPEAKNLGEVYQLSREAGLGREVKLRILLGTFALSAGYYDAYYLKAQQVQNLIRAQFQKAFTQVDAIVSPVTPTPAFKLNAHLADPLQMYLSDAFTIPGNLAGIPGISVPAGFTQEGLPVGLQILGGLLQEEKIFRLAHWFEQNQTLSPPPLAL